jgi:hypothetical protein
MHLGARVLRSLRAVATIGLIVSVNAATADAQPEPEGRFPLGSLVSVTPGFVFVTGYDTNLKRTGDGEPGYEYYLVPQVEGWVGRGRARLNFVAAVEYSDQAGSTTWNNLGVVRLDAGSGQTAARVVASHRNAYAPPSDFVGFELGIKSRRVENAFEGYLTVQTGGRWEARGLARFMQLRYDADAQYEGVSLQDDLNRDTLEFGGSLGLAITPLTSAVGTVEFSQDRFIYSPDRDGNGYSVVGGVQFQPLALLTGRAQAGYMRYETVLLGQVWDGPTYTVALTLNRAPYFLEVTSGRSIDFSFDPSRGFYVTTGIDVYGTMLLGGDWDVFGRWSSRRLSPQGPRAEDEPFRGIGLGKAGLAYRIGLYTKVGTEVERYSYGGPGGFDGVRATVFLTYGSDRFQRLDRPLPGEF